MHSGFRNNSNPLVAIFMVTYNHGPYIAQAIQSVLNQKTTFPIRLFIGEDASSDNTGDLCEHFATNHPEKITLFRRDKNIGIFQNANLLFDACIDSGAKYIAMLEGDDYWICDEKLQNQVSYLEEHSDCAGSYHRTDFLLANGDRKPMFKQLPDIMSLSNVVGKYSPFHTTSFVFRAEHFCRPAWFNQIHSVDMAMYMWHAQFGYFKGFQETWSVYRIHSTGMTATLDRNDSLHQKRSVMYQMMMGKIKPAFHQSLIDTFKYHQLQLNQKTEMVLQPVLFFNAKKDVESQKLLMEITSSILPINVIENQWIDFLGAFKLTKWTKFNQCILRWRFRKFWNQIQAVVFYSDTDREIFTSQFGDHFLPMIIVQMQANPKETASWLEQVLINIKKKD